MGGNPYSQEVREEVITQYVLGIPLQSPDLDALQAVYAYPSLQTCMWYINQYHELGHWDNKIATGNHQAEREVLGQPLVRLALYRLVHPEAPISHVQAFLFNMDPTVPLYYTAAIGSVEKEILYHL